MADKKPTPDVENREDIPPVEPPKEPKIPEGQCPQPACQFNHEGDIWAAIDHFAKSRHGGRR